MEVTRRLVRNTGTQEALHELPKQFPAGGRDEAGSVLDFDEHALEVGVHGDSAQLDEKVGYLEAGTLGLHPRLLFAGVYRSQFLHQVHEERIRDERHLLLPRLQDAEHGGGLFGIVEKVNG
ncbi:hypothetical protein FOCC_FOCC011187, partial [Frankliniella occidentalis]